MLESERLAWLDALGIQQYVALAPVAGAASLPELTPEQIWAAEYVTAVAESESVPESEPTPVAPVVAAQQPHESEYAVKTAVAAAVQASSTAASARTTELSLPPDLAEGEIPQLDVSKLRQAEQPVTRPIRKAAPPVQKFALAVVTIPHQFRLLVELALPDAPGLSALEHRVLSDLLLALGQADGLDHNAAKLYRWPILNNPSLASNAEAARDALLAFIGSAPAVTRSVFLGSKAAALLSEVAAGESFSLGPQSTAIHTHSLAAMQQDWTLKAGVWQQLHSFLSEPAAV